MKKIVIAVVLAAFAAPVLGQYSGGYTGAMNDQARRDLMDAQRRALDAYSHQPSVAAEPSTPEQRGSADQWKRWLKQSLDSCGANERCKEIANRTFANNLRCAKGDGRACDERYLDLEDIEQYNAQRRKSAPQVSSQDALMKCLQDTASSVAARCRETNCDTSLLVDVIGIAQRVSCGYSAIQPIQQPAARTPQMDYLCVDAMTSGGGVSWGMAMQTCSR